MVFPVESVQYPNLDGYCADCSYGPLSFPPPAPPFLKAFSKAVPRLTTAKATGSCAREGAARAWLWTTGSSFVRVCSQSDRARLRPVAHWLSRGIALRQILRFRPAWTLPCGIRSWPVLVLPLGVAPRRVLSACGPAASTGCSGSDVLGPLSGLPPVSSLLTGPVSVIPLCRVGL